MPELTPSRIPAGAYSSLLRQYETLGSYNFAVAHGDLPDDLVYNVVRAVFDNHEEMLEATAAAAATISRQPRSQFLSTASPRRDPLLQTNRKSRSVRLGAESATQIIFG